MQKKYVSYKYFTAVTVAFVAVLLISNIISTKLVDFGFLIFDAGTLLFPFAYIFGDLLTEVYGYKKSRQVIWMGFGAALLMSLVFIGVNYLPAAADWGHQAAYEAILGLAPRIVLASLLAYLVGEFLNSSILAKMKVHMQGKRFALRAIVSTLVGQGADTIIFILVAFTGIFPWPVIVSIIISNYIFKVGVEVVFLPITSRVVKWFKKHENEDYYDTDTNFNPFKFK
jgi:uncharacterized integral membrane protein (TIGR00697 family)